MKTVDINKINKNINWPQDYPEDFKEENGNYLHSCINCNSAFVGHKRRVVCKICGEKK